MQKKLSKNQQKNLCRIYNLTYTVYIYKRLFKEAHINEALLHCEKKSAKFLFWYLSIWLLTCDKIKIMYATWKAFHGTLMSAGSYCFQQQSTFLSHLVWIDKHLKKKMKIGFHVWKIFFWIRIEDNFVNELFWLFKIFQRPTDMFEKMNQEPPIVINASLSPPHPPDISHVKPSPHLTFGLNCKCWQKKGTEETEGGE